MRPEIVAILCLDANRDGQNRISLIGMYETSIVVTQLPNLQEYTLYFRITGMKKGDHDIQVRIIEPGLELTTMNLVATVVDADLPWNFYHKLPIPITHYGDLHVKFTVDRGKLINALTIPVISPQKMHQVHGSN